MLHDGRTSTCATALAEKNLPTQAESTAVDDYSIALSMQSNDLSATVYDQPSLSLCQE